MLGEQSPLASLTYGRHVEEQSSKERRSPALVRAARVAACSTAPTFASRRSSWLAFGVPRRLFGRAGGCTYRSRWEVRALICPSESPSSEGVSMTPPSSLLSVVGAVVADVSGCTTSPSESLSNTITLRGPLLARMGVPGANVAHDFCWLTSILRLASLMLRVLLHEYPQATCSAAWIHV